jgi:hypothetical protein
MVVCEKWPKENAKGRRKMSSSNSSEAAESAHAAAPKRRTRRPKATLNNQHQQQVGFGVGESIGGGDDQQDALQAASTFPNSLSSLSTATDESSNDLLLQNATALLAAAFNNSRLRQQCEGLVGRYLGHNGYQASSNGDIPAELEPLLASSYSSSVEKEQHGKYITFR